MDKSYAPTPQQVQTTTNKYLLEDSTFSIPLISTTPLPTLSPSIPPPTTPAMEIIQDELSPSTKMNNSQLSTQNNSDTTNLHVTNSTNEMHPTQINSTAALSQSIKLLEPQLKLNNSSQPSLIKIPKYVFSRSNSTKSNESMPNTSHQISQSNSTKITLVKDGNFTKPFNESATNNIYQTTISPIILPSKEVNGSSTTNPTIAFQRDFISTNNNNTSKNYIINS